jgi:hypothetical protein
MHVSGGKTALEAVAQTNGSGGDCCEAHILAGHCKLLSALPSTLARVKIKMHGTKRTAGVRSMLVQTSGKPQLTHCCLHHPGKSAWHGSQSQCCTYSQPNSQYQFTDGKGGSRNVAPGMRPAGGLATNLLPGFGAFT